MKIERRTVTTYPWGFWATCGWGVCVVAAFVVAQMVVVAVAVGVSMAARNAGGLDAETMETAAIEMSSRGDVLGASAVLSAILGGVVVYAAIRWRRGLSPAAYLDLHRARLRPLLVWIGIAVLAGIIYDLVWPLLGVEKVSAFMREAVRTGGRSPWLWLGVVVAAPLFEELFCRGFLLSGWMRSPLRPTGAVVLVSLLWTLAHVQYGWLEMVWIFLLGLVLGAARLRTGSLWTPIAAHMLINLVATVQAVRLVG